MIPFKRAQLSEISYSLRKYPNLTNPHSFPLSERSPSEEAANSQSFRRSYARKTIKQRERENRDSVRRLFRVRKKMIFQENLAGLCGG